MQVIVDQHIGRTGESRNGGVLRQEWQVIDGVAKDDVAGAARVARNRRAGSSAPPIGGRVNGFAPGVNRARLIQRDIVEIEMVQGAIASGLEVAEEITGA